MSNARNKLRIGIDCHNLEGNRTGVGRYLKNILERFANLQTPTTEVVFYCYFKNKIPDDPFLKKNARFIPRVLKIPHFKASFLLYFLLLLPRAYKTDRLDLLWFPSYMVPFTFRGNCVVTIHDVVYERYPKSVPLRYRIFYQLFSRYGARIAKKIITVSQFSKKEIINYYHQTAERIAVTPLGLDEKFSTAPEVLSVNALRRVQKKYGVKNRYLLYLGQLFERRHPVTMIDAFFRSAPQFPEYQLLIIGTNRIKPFVDIDALCKKYNASLGRPVFIRSSYAPESAIIDLYRGATAFIYLSDYEGFGLPPLEAQRCKTPAISSATSSLNEVLQSSALMIRNNTAIEEIATAMTAVMKNSALRATLIKNGYQNSLRFDFDHTAQQTLDLLLSACRS